MAEEVRLAPRRILFLVLPKVHILDLAGPLQAFFEAAEIGGPSADFRLSYCGRDASVRSAQGLQLTGIDPLPSVGPSDLVITPGIDSSALDALADATPVEWLQSAVTCGARVGSICSGAFVLAEAGLLDGRECTTHWKLTERLARGFPETRVLPNRLFVRSGPIITSAGVTSGIDLALSLIEEAYGALLAARVARELVVYLRRDGASEQQSIYLQYRAHSHPGVHRVQDWLVAHPDENPSLDALSTIARMSPRHLTRTFRAATGTSLKDFSSRLKLEVAMQLLRDPQQTVEQVAHHCGYHDARQLRRLFRRHHGQSPAQWQEQQCERPAS